jgi:hypothetical protein
VDSERSIAAVIQALLTVSAALLTSGLRRRLAALHRELNRALDERLAD